MIHRPAINSSYSLGEKGTNQWWEEQGSPRLGGQGLRRMLFLGTSQPEIGQFRNSTKKEPQGCKLVSKVEASYLLKTMHEVKLDTIKIILAFFPK